MSRGTSTSSVEARGRSPNHVELERVCVRERCTHELEIPSLERALRNLTQGYSKRPGRILRIGGGGPLFAQTTPGEALKGDVKLGVSRASPKSK